MKAVGIGIGVVSSVKLIAPSLKTAFAAGSNGAGFSAGLSALPWMPFSLGALAVLAGLFILKKKWGSDAPASAPAPA